MERGRGLASDERIRRRREFERVFAEGVRIHGRFATFFMLASAHSRPRLGVAVSRRVGGAVQRNRAKRLVREVFRRHKHRLDVWPQPGVDVVVVPRREVLDVSFASLEADYLSALERRVGPAARRPRSAREGSPRRPKSV